MEGPVGLTDPDVTGIGAFGDGGERELGSQFSWEVLE